VIHVVLPAYNEERRIGGLLDRIDEAMHEESLSYAVVAVDDGSTDATAAIVRERAGRMPISLVEHPRNLGLGAAIRDGVAAAARQAAERDVIVTMDADATHAPALILRMVRMLREGYDVVIASRYQPGSRQVGVPLGRRALSRAGSLLVRFFPTPGQGLHLWLSGLPGGGAPVGAPAPGPDFPEPGRIPVHDRHPPPSSAG
jgi:dolichol-phosphate mannosyltransferase